jgi:hypothetical protein
MAHEARIIWCDPPVRQAEVVLEMGKTGQHGVTTRVPAAVPPGWAARRTAADIR